MNKTIFILFFGALFLLSFKVTYAAVSFNEFAWMGVVGENGQYGEWIELYNNGDNDVPLAGWTIAADGGSQTIFTLTKTISAHGYLLVERTTASMPDPVPGINDEQGSFGGGGLSNSGEHIVLKDVSGVLIQNLDFSGGWPAGDASSRKTMQWDGSSWITAQGTPKSQNNGSSVGSGSGEEAEDSSDNESSVSITPKITLSVPSNLYQYISYDITADIVLEDGLHHSSGIIWWNMGDGTVIKQYRLAPVSHRYIYPGTYTIWVDYYQSSIDKEPILSTSKIVKVGTPDITLTVLNSDAIKITNQSGSAIDLSSWKIFSGNNYAQLPERTILAMDASIVFSAKLLGLPSFSHPVLTRPTGEPLVPTTPSSSMKASSTANNTTTHDDTAAVVKGISTSTDEHILPLPSNTTNNNRTKKIIFGAVAAILLALFVLLERSMAKGE